MFTLESSWRPNWAHWPPVDNRWSTLCTVEPFKDKIPKGLTVKCRKQNSLFFFYYDLRRNIKHS